MYLPVEFVHFSLSYQHYSLIFMGFPWQHRKVMTRKRERDFFCFFFTATGWNQTLASVATTQPQYVSSKTLFQHIQHLSWRLGCLSHTHMDIYGFLVLLKDTWIGVPADKAELLLFQLHVSVSVYITLFNYQSAAIIVASMCHALSLETKENTLMRCFRFSANCIFWLAAFPTTRYNS